MPISHLASFWKNHRRGFTCCCFLSSTTSRLSSPRKRGPIATELSIIHRSCLIARARRMGPRLRGDDRVRCTRVRIHEQSVHTNSISIVKKANAPLPPVLVRARGFARISLISSPSKTRGVARHKARPRRTLRVARVRAGPRVHQRMHPAPCGAPRGLSPSRLIRRSDQAAS